MNDRLACREPARDPAQACFRQFVGFVYPEFVYNLSSRVIDMPSNQSIWHEVSDTEVALTPPYIARGSHRELELPGAFVLTGAGAWLNAEALADRLLIEMHWRSLVWLSRVTCASAKMLPEALPPSLGTRTIQGVRYSRRPRDARIVSSPNHPDPTGTAPRANSVPGVRHVC